MPQIGRYLGKADKLIFPEVNVSIKTADNKKQATITITAKEELVGIKRIEIWQAGEKLDEFPYENIKTEITKEYEVRQNGKYQIKVYGDLMSSKTVEVTGILSSVKFEPSENSEWKKEHVTKVTIQETGEKIVKARYQWINSVAEPNDDVFPEEQTFQSGDTITKNGITGTYYLWVMLETESGEKVKWISEGEGFNFDNEGPTITAFTPTKNSLTAITLSATVQDNKLGTTKFEFYVDDELKSSQPCSVTTASVTKSINITGLATGNHKCKVIVYDAENNSSTLEVNGSTKLYAWTKWNAVAGTEYVHKLVQSDVQKSVSLSYEWSGSGGILIAATSVTINPKTGVYTGSGIRNWSLEKNTTPINHYYMGRNGDLASCKEVWYIKRTVSGGNTDTNFICDIYKGSPTTVYYKGTTSYPVVTSPSPTRYTSGQRNSDGFWYVSTTPQ